MNQNNYTAEKLQHFAERLFLALGLAPNDASLVSASLVQADLWGHQSHGIMRTLWYGARILSGSTQIASTPTTLVDSGAITVIDGNNSIGQVIVQNAMKRAIARAKRHGIGAVSVRNSGHFGTAMYFTRFAAHEGCIGFLSTNASPAMAPWGGRQKLIGTNPWSIAAPAGAYPPMMLDIATTAVARGKLYVAKQQGEPIPLGWAIDEQGSKTNDPIAGIAGTILPMAGHKGYAIATMIDVLSGVLSGSQFADGVVGPYMAEGRSGAGHLAIALNISAFRPLEEFCQDMEQLILKIKNTPRTPGTEEILYPGEPESRAEKYHRQHGISIPPDTIIELNAAAKDFNIEGLS